MECFSSRLYIKKGNWMEDFYIIKHKTDETLMTVKIVSEKNVWRTSIKNSKNKSVTGKWDIFLLQNSLQYYI